MKKRWFQNSLSFLLKLLLTGIALYFLLERTDLQKITETFARPLFHPWLLSALFLILWSLNLYIDAYFWTRIHLMLENVRIMRGLKINLICYALSFVTPANSGEWAGRYVMMSEPENRKKSVFLNFWMHLPKLFAKLLITPLAGLLLLYLAEGAEGWQVAAGSVLVIALVLVPYLYLKRIQSWLHLKEIRQFKIRNYLLKGRPTLIEKLLFLFLASVKFITYNLQFGAVLLFFSPEGLPASVWLAIPVYYLIGSLLPSIAAADFVLKSAIAIWIFQPVWNKEEILVIASIIIWFFNIVLPSFAGIYVIIRTNLFRSFKKKFSRGILNGL